MGHLNSTVGTGNRELTNFIYRLYGSICYLLGLISLMAFALFANNAFVEVGIASGGTLLGAFSIDIQAGYIPANPYLVNIGLIIIFALQHSIMARAGFKDWIVKILPKPLERSTYVLATATALFSLILYWQPMIGIIWQVETPIFRGLLQGLFWTGWLITLLATQMIDGMHLLGIKQSFRPQDPDNGIKNFVTPAFYKLVRHPIQTGVIIAMLSTPDMTVGRAVLAIGIIIYIIVGLYYEERDMIAEFGDTYRDYKSKVPALFPRFGTGK